MRIPEGMAIARANGRLRGKQPKLSARQRAHLVGLHQSGQHTIAELAELFSVSRPTVYLVLERARTSQRDRRDRRDRRQLPVAPAERAALEDHAAGDGPGMRRNLTTIGQNLMADEGTRMASARSIPGPA